MHADAIVEQLDILEHRAASGLAVPERPSAPLKEECGLRAAFFFLAAGPVVQPDVRLEVSLRFSEALSLALAGARMLRP